MSDKRRGDSLSPVLRYPGGKQRMLTFLGDFLPCRDDIRGKYVEPFVGGGAVFFHVQPVEAILSDSNAELIDVYRGIRDDPVGVWERYEAFGNTKEEYHRVRSLCAARLGLTERAARSLYLNRTCFKGNWRHNANGQFNVGYGGQSRRWVITRDYLVAVSRALSTAELLCSDFEAMIDASEKGDFLFLDPPYRPGERELVNDHYSWKHFAFADHQRLAGALRRCVHRGATWCMTTSAHSDILALFEGFPAWEAPPRGRGPSRSGEVLISNHGGWG